MSRHRRKLFCQPAPRRRRWPWLMALLASCPLVTALVWPEGNPPMASGLGHQLTWQTPGQMPPWVQKALAPLIDEPRSQYLVALADLNRDQRAEILIAPAPRAPDIFVPDTPLRVVQQSHDRWRLSQADVSCRPLKLGGFITNGYWDLPCRSKKGRHALRWAGQGYVNSVKF